MMQEIYSATTVASATTATTWRTANEQATSAMHEVPDELKDFRNFLYITWKHLGLPDPTPVQYDIAEYLQHGPRRRMVQAFRGVGKSWITSAFGLWNLLMDPDTKILVVSASKSRADDFSSFCHRLIREMPVLQHLAPDESQRSSKIAWDVGPAKAAHSPSCKSVGITGQLTGSRANLIIADDVEVPSNSATVGSRYKLSESTKEFEAIIVPDTGEIVYLGTPQSQESIYSELPERGYDVRIYPARVPEDPGVYGDRLAAYVSSLDAEAGEPTDPGRFSDEELLEREASYGRTGFQLQYQLDVRLSDLSRHPLRLTDLIVMDCDSDVGPERVLWQSSDVWEDLPNTGFSRDKYCKPLALHGDMVAYTGSVLTVDPSGRGTDQTAYCVLKYLNGFLYLLDWGGTAEGYTDSTMRLLATKAKEYKVNKIVTESNYGGGMFTELLKPHLREIYPVTIEETTAKGMKEARMADTLEPVMNQHRLVLNAQAIRKDYEETLQMPPDVAVHYSLPHQMSRLSRDRGCLQHDDKLDALTMAVAYWTEQMARDARDAMQDRRDELLQQELDSIIGNKSEPPKWFNV